MGVEVANLSALLEDVTEFLKEGFLLCPEVSEEEVDVFDFIPKMTSLLKEEDEYTINLLFHFIDMYPFTSLQGCSSIASANLYENDMERQMIGSYEVFVKVPLAVHTLNGIRELNRVFSRSTELGINVKVGEKRYHLATVDYFHLLVAYLYHDIAKSPVVLFSMGYNETEYRKSDHAFFSGQYLAHLKRDFEEHGIEVPESLFMKLYVPVVSHHQRPVDPHAILLKYIDQKAREYESQKFGSGIVNVPAFSPSSEETDSEIKRKIKEGIKSKIDHIEVPDDLIGVVLNSAVKGIRPRKRETVRTIDGRKVKVREITYIRFPPKIYFASFHIQFLLRHHARKLGMMVPDLHDERAKLDIARYVIRKLRTLGYIKEKEFSDDYLAGWWYEVTARNGKKYYFFGFPVQPPTAMTSRDTSITEVRPLTKEELQQKKITGELLHMSSP